MGKIPPSTWRSPTGLGGGIDRRGAEIDFDDLQSERTDTIIYLASSPEVEGVSGRYFADREVISSFEEPHDVSVQRGLWAESEELTNLRVAS